MITEAMVKLCIVQGSFRSVESSWHWDCCTLKAISLSSCPCGSTWKFSQKFFLKDTQTHIILFSPVVIIWVLLLRLYCIFFHLISSRKLLIGIGGEFLRTSNKKKQEHLFAVLFKNLLTIAFTLSPFHHFFSKLGNGSREDVTGSRKRWSWCLSADLFLFPLG